MIKQVKVKNFKSLTDVTVDLDELTVLIGRSGSGKTNFVDALRFIRQYLTIRNLSFVPNALGGWERIISATAARPVEVFFEIVFSVEGVRGDFSYSVTLKQLVNQSPFRNEELKLVGERLSLGGESLFEIENGKWAKPPKISTFATPGSEPMLATLSGSQEVAIAYVYLTEGLGCYDFPSDVLQKTERGQNKSLADDGVNFIDAFGAIEGNLQALRNWREIIEALRSLIPSIKSIETSRPDRKSIVVSYEIGDRAVVLNLSQESEGLRRFLAYMIALYQSPPKQTHVFEEPEKGIHPGALATLAEQLKACPKAGRGQVIFTTHSPELLDLFNIENVRVVERSKYDTKIGPVTSEQVQAVKESLLSTGELLTVDPARLSSVSAEAGA